MLCQSCKKKEATFHYTSNENGAITELHLCRDCAQKNGYLDESLKKSAVCPFCGMRFNEFIHNGKAGCAKCYATFKDAIAPTIKKLHGNTKHTGRFPAGRAIHKTKEDKRAELEALLKAAIEKQEYEKAAEYRDKIKELDKKDA